MKTFFQYLTIAFTLCLVFFSKISHAQSGCTDPQANNYDPTAIENDGSCVYPNTNYSPGLVAILPTNLTECSGLAFFNNLLWTHLDGGNADQLIELDTLSGAAKATVTIPNSTNTDWEDLAEDAEHIYIGDFGNNFGNRTDLRIYKIKKSNLTGGTPLPQLIQFSYSDQTVFTSAPNNNNYDCEAFFFWNDSLHLFSKNWVDFKTRHYVLPATPGIHIAELRDSLNVQGQVTAADISDEGVALLLGYNKSTSEAFMWLLFDFQEGRFFSGNKRRISLGSAIGTSQVEGITFKDNKKGYICSEEFSILPPKLLSFDVSQWLPNPVPTRAINFQSGLSIFPNPTADKLTFSLEGWSSHPLKVTISDITGKNVMGYVLENTQSMLTISISQLPTGPYLISVSNGEAQAASLFYKK